MALEIDVLAVGEKSKGGDAVALRFGDLHGSRNEQIVMVVDGGTKDSGQELVTHIRNRYRTDRVDIVVSTHPDADHISGLTKVLTHLEVDELWMNRPTNHSAVLEAMARNASGRLLLNAQLRESIEQADQVEQLARDNGVPIREAFFDGQCSDFGAGYQVYILGPTQFYYEQLCEEMREQKEQAKQTLTAAVANYARSVGTQVLEAVGKETLTDEGETSPSNNSSVVLLVRTPDGDAFLAADAGIPALEYVVTHAEQLGIDLSTCHFQQVPHHGSKRNIGPTLLNTLIGPKWGSRSPISVCVSAPKEGRPKHPSFNVTNAYKRRGADVFTTEGESFWFRRGQCPQRTGYRTATPLGYGPEEDE
ncbi:MAG: hypothetical protein KDB01_22645 [Planctomycetaceae bacterium]|nr:hypothetical protein [Planctomycetaceae bacterium]